MKKEDARIFEAIIDEFGLDDGGCASFTFQVQSLKKGKIYKEYMIWNGKQGIDSSYEPSGRVVDDNGCSWHIGDKSFQERFRVVQ